MLEDEKAKAGSQYFRLKGMIGEAEQTLAQKRKQMTHTDQESEYDYTSNSGKDS
jgi:hypothetical protein